jgi:hypothetical protein
MNTNKYNEVARVRNYAHTVITGGTNRNYLLGMGPEEYRKWIRQRLPIGLDYEGFGETWYLSRIVPATEIDMDDVHAEALFGHAMNTVPVPIKLAKFPAVSYAHGLRILEKRMEDNPDAAFKLMEILNKTVSEIPKIKEAL